MYIFRQYFSNEKKYVLGRYIVFLVLKIRRSSLQLFFVYWTTLRASSPSFIHVSDSTLRVCSSVVQQSSLQSYMNMYLVSIIHDIVALLDNVHYSTVVLSPHCFSLHLNFPLLLEAISKLIFFFLVLYPSRRRVADFRQAPSLKSGRSSH